MHEPGKPSDFFKELTEGIGSVRTERKIQRAHGGNFNPAGRTRCLYFQCHLGPKSNGCNTLGIT